MQWTTTFAVPFRTTLSASATAVTRQQDLRELIRVRVQRLVTVLCTADCPKANMLTGATRLVADSRRHLSHPTTLNRNPLQMLRANININKYTTTRNTRCAVNSERRNLLIDLIISYRFLRQATCEQDRLL